MKQYFLIIHKPGSAWKEGEGFQNQDLMEHGAYIHNLFKQGKAIEGGPFLDDTGGMAIFIANDLEHAKELVKQDPAIIKGVFTADIRPWMRVDWENF